MTKLKDKIKTALDEARMLILGAQVLIGFNYRSVFEAGFEKLPAPAQYLKLLSLALMLLTAALLMSPGAYHRIVHDGEDALDVHSFTTGVMDWALLPFAIGLSLDFGVATGTVAPRAYAILVAVSVGLVALFFWYGLGWLQKDATERNQKMEKSSTELKDKINQTLTEARVVLPGAQALLGFQFATMLMESFEKLPASSKYVHLISLALMGATVILLMAPAAYHRIVENGEDTERFQRFAGLMLLAAMIPLPLGISGDFFVVARKITQSDLLALSLCVAILACFYGLWFGYTLFRRRKVK